MEDNYPIELCVSQYALFCVSMPSRHKELLEITASCFTDVLRNGTVDVDPPAPGLEAQEDPKFDLDLG